MTGPFRSVLYSDHFPIVIDLVKSMPKDNVPRWNLKKANWPKFILQRFLDINRHSFSDITEKFPAFLNKLNDIAINVCQSQLDSPLVATNHGSIVNAKSF